jgi:hypothetical protein
VETYGANDTLRLASIAFALPLDDLYRDLPVPG